MRKTLSLLVLLAVTAPTSAQQKWALLDGITTIALAEDELARHEIQILSSTRTSDPSEIVTGLGFVVKPRFATITIAANGSISDMQGELRNVGRLEMSSRANVLRLTEFAIVYDGAGAQKRLLLLSKPYSNAVAEALMSASAETLNFSPESKTLRLPPTPLLLTEAGAQQLGLAPGLYPIGILAFSVSVKPGPANGAAKTPAPAQAAATRADLTFCSLDTFSYRGRSGDLAAFSMTTTSWNVGNIPLAWWRAPDWRHPYIVMNIYRIRDDRFEQIGESWVKHGFFAASNDQCGGTCDFATNADRLGVGCTDTYGASTNASTTYLAPRSEIDPWAGFWDRTDSHLSAPAHTHGPIDHLLKIHDADIDQPTNGNAAYVAEAYYVHYQDMDVMNNAAWKPILYRSGAPGGVWNFEMSDESTSPNIGFAIDAWTGARKTLLAQQIPVQETVSPDGRAILAAKSRDLGSGRWRYDYSLLNVDMDRQIDSFRVAIPAGVTVADLTFHAPEHHEIINQPGHVPIDNAPWSASVAGNVVSWSTASNPLAWGTTYTFSFTADRAPGDAAMTVGLFKPGTVATVTGVTTGPH